MIIWYASRSLTKALGTGSVYSHNSMREILLRPILMSENWHGAIKNLPQDDNQCVIEWEPSSDG